MENQHRKISGYRELDQATIDAMNEGKRLEAETLKFLASVAHLTDPRWAAIAKTDLQKAFMYLGRAIARPEGD